jgi:hypothetical protein
MSEFYEADVGVSTHRSRTAASRAKLATPVCPCVDILSLY